MDKTSSSTLASTSFSTPIRPPRSNEAGKGTKCTHLDASFSPIDRLHVTMASDTIQDVYEFRKLNSDQKLDIFLHNSRH